MTHAEASLVPGSYSVQILRKQAQRALGQSGLAMLGVLDGETVTTSPPPRIRQTVRYARCHHGAKPLQAALM